MSELKAIIKQICAEKGISESAVMETINSALAAAFRKDFGDKLQNIVAEYDLDTGKTRVFDEKTVVEDLTEDELAQLEKLKTFREERKAALEDGQSVEKSEEELQLEETVRKFNPKTEVELKDAKKISDDYVIGDVIHTELQIPGDFGRMAAQTAKQVIIQRLKEAERNVVYQTFKDKEGIIVSGVVQKREGRNLLIDINHVTAILPPTEQIRNERYNIGDRLKVIILTVAMNTRGPEIIVSRASTEFVKKLFEREIPEISNKVIEVKNVSREAGSRTKIAVYTADQNIDPIGSCIGQRGSRIQTIINELSGEKIDVIEYSDDPKKFIANALLPAKITHVEINEADSSAVVTVPAEQLSLTIGRDGQNVRLAVKLTGWKINIKEAETGKEVIDSTADAAAPAKTAEAVSEEPKTETAEKTDDEKPVKKKKSTKKTAAKKTKKTKTKE
jgi:transcription termination/antitermination protein NusA